MYVAAFQMDFATADGANVFYFRWLIISAIASALQHQRISLAMQKEVN